MFISKLNVQFNKCGKRESKKKNEPDTKLYSTPSPNSFKPTNPCSNTNVCIESTRVDWQLDPYPPTPYYLPNFMSACCGWDFYSIPEIRPKVTNKIKNQKHLKNKTYPPPPKKTPVVLYLNSWRSYIKLFHICTCIYIIYILLVFSRKTGWYLYL